MQKSNRLLYLLALIKIILPYFLQNHVYEPHRDELLYLAEGHHMTWGFMEVPPLLSVFAWLTKNFALLLLFLPFIFGVYLRLFFLFQPNTPEVFFWTMIVYSVIRFVQTKRNKWLYVLGVSIGLGMMSKYSVAFFTVSIFIGLLLTKHRIIFLNKHFWYGLFLAFIIFLPNFIWQYNFHFPVVHHMIELQRTQLQYVSRFDFLKDQ